MRRPARSDPAEPLRDRGGVREVVRPFRARAAFTVLSIIAVKVVMSGIGGGGPAAGS